MLFMYRGDSSRMWHVGFSLEDSGPCMEFLHCIVEFAAYGGQGAIKSQPRTQNEAYSKGLDALPRTCTTAPFILGFSRPAHLRVALMPRLWLLAGAFTTTNQTWWARPVIWLCTEFLRLGWPASWITSCLLAYENYN